MCMENGEVVLNKSDLPEYIVKFFAKCFRYSPDEIRKTWSFDGEKLVPYNKELPVHVVFISNSEQTDAVEEKDLSVEISTENDIETLEFKIPIEVKTVNTYKFIGKKAWAITFSQAKKAQKESTDKIIIPFTYEPKKEKWRWWGLISANKADLEKVSEEIWSKIVSFVTPRVEKREEKKEDVKIEDIDSAIKEFFDEFGLAEEKAPEKKEKEEEVQEMKKEDVERVFEGYLRREGLIRRKVIVFDLPSEYLGTKTTYREENGRTVETRVLPENAKTYRTLRKYFYNTLHGIAFRTLMGWVALSDADVSQLNPLISKLNKLSGEERKIYILEVYLPKYFVTYELAKYIEERKASLEELSAKAEEEGIKAQKLRRIQREMRLLAKEIAQLESELKMLSKEEE